MMDPHFKMIKDTSPEFTENMLDMDSVFEFELMVRWDETSKSLVQDCISYSDRVVNNKHVTTGIGT